MFTPKMTEIEQAIYDEIVYADKQGLGAAKALKDAYLKARKRETWRQAQIDDFARSVYEYVCDDILWSYSVGYARRSADEVISVAEDAEEDLRNNIVAKACEYVAEQINYARLADFLFRYYWEALG